MSKFDKLLMRIRKLDKNMRFEELKKVLEEYGYTMQNQRSGSSHYQFQKPGKRTITIPKHCPIKVAYVALVKSIVEGEDD